MAPTSNFARSAEVNVKTAAVKNCQRVLAIKYKSYERKVVFMMDFLGEVKTMQSDRERLVGQIAEAMTNLFGWEESKKRLQAQISELLQLGKPDEAVAASTALSSVNIFLADAQNKLSVFSPQIEALSEKSKSLLARIRAAVQTQTEVVDSATKELHRLYVEAMDVGSFQHLVADLVEWNAGIAGSNAVQAKEQTKIGGV